MRDAWSLRIVRELLDARMHVSVYDPASMENALKIFGKTVKYAKSVRDCLEGAECCFIVTEWDEFKAIPPSLFGEAMARPVLIDGRRALDTSTLGPEIVYRTVGANRVSREVTPH